jgi:hypothetical protein
MDGGGGGGGDNCEGTGSLKARLSRIQWPSVSACTCVVYQFKIQPMAYPD